MHYPLPEPGIVSLPGYPSIERRLHDARGLFRIDGEPRGIHPKDMDLAVSEWARVERSPWQVRRAGGEHWAPFDARLTPSEGSC